MRKRIGTCSAAVLAVTAAFVSPLSAQAAEDHAATKAVLDQYLPHAGPGAAVYAGDATGSWTVHSGTASIRENRPITPGDHFRIASQTKTFTAVVVLQLVDEGLVGLDAPIERYLPGVVAGNGYDPNVITVRQILQHTSGIARDSKNPKAEADGTYRLAELVRSGLTQAPQFPPGTDFGYSNINYLILGMMIERLTGQSVGDAITARIITPLGLSETRFPAAGDRSMAAPYLPGYQGGRLPPFFLWVDVTNSLELSYISSAGAIESTMTDLARFERALADGEFVSAASLAEMRELVPASPDYGLGLMHLDLSCGGEAWGHAGDLTTGHSSVTMVTDDGRYAALVTNTIVTSTAEPSRGDVIDAALCEGAAE